MNDFSQRLEQVKSNISAACAKVGRNPDDITLVAVSKKHPLSAIQAFRELGQLTFGESYVQEALDKQEEAAKADILSASEFPAITWHFIGGLQTNKAKFVAGRFDLVHSVDSIKLARKLDKKAVELGCNQNVLLQVNIACEAQKCGVEVADSAAVANEIMEMQGLTLKGLMLMPPWDPDAEKSRPWFAQLRELRDRLVPEVGDLPHLSMGMSNDYVQAVEEGATLIRVGTTLFGQRAY